MIRRPRPRELAAAFVVAGIAALLLWPHHVDGAIDWIASSPVFGAQAGMGHAVWWALEDLGNAALFVPLGFALARWTRKPLLALAAGAAVSVLCELAQHWIPTRQPSLLDVAMNVLGTAVGVLIAVGVRRRTANAAVQA
jgi:VanZ family protein